MTSSLREPLQLFQLAGATLILLLLAYVLFVKIGIVREYRADMILIIIAAFLWVVLFNWASAKKKATLSMALCLFLGFFQIGDRFLSDLIHRRLNQLAEIIWHFRNTTAKEKDAIVARRTYQGTTIYEVHNMTYDTPLPSTRYFNPWLQWRAPGKLMEGFRNSRPYDLTRYGYSVQVIDPSQFIEAIKPE